MVTIRWGLGLWGGKNGRERGGFRKGRYKVMYSYVRLGEMIKLVITKFKNEENSHQEGVNRIWNKIRKGGMKNGNIRLVREKKGHNDKGLIITLKNTKLELNHIFRKGKRGRGGRKSRFWSDRVRI